MFYTSHLYFIFYISISRENSDCKQGAPQILFYYIFLYKIFSRASCHQLFKQLEVLPLQSQYILSTLLFVAKNKNLCATNQDFHTISTRYNSDLHLPACNLALYQQGAYFSGIKLFNHLPQKMKGLSVDIRVFKPALLRSLK
jgi:hypothetical protein